MKDIRESIMVILDKQGIAIFIIIAAIFMYYRYLNDYLIPARKSDKELEKERDERLTKIQEKLTDSVVDNHDKLEECIKELIELQSQVNNLVYSTNKVEDKLNEYDSKCNDPESINHNLSHVTIKLDEVANSIDTLQVSINTLLEDNDD